MPAAVSTRLRLLRSRPAGQRLVTPDAALDVVASALRSPDVAKLLKRRGASNLTMADVERLARRDKALREALVSAVRRELERRGLPAEAAKTVTMTGLRMGKAVELLRGSRASGVVAAQASKLLRLAEELADHFAGGNVLKLARMYRSSSGVRQAVHSYISSRVESDPGLSALRGVPPDKVFAAAVGLRIATMDRVSLIRNSETVRAVLKSAAVNTGKSMMMFGYTYIMGVSNILFNMVMPGAANSILLAMDTSQRLKMMWRESIIRNQVMQQGRGPR